MVTVPESLLNAIPQLERRMLMMEQQFIRSMSNLHDAVNTLSLRVNDFTNGNFVLRFVNDRSEVGKQSPSSPSLSSDASGSSETLPSLSVSDDPTVTPEPVPYTSSTKGSSTALVTSTRRGPHVPSTRSSSSRIQSPTTRSASPAPTTRAKSTTRSPTTTTTTTTTKRRATSPLKSKDTSSVKRLKGSAGSPTPNANFKPLEDVEHASTLPDLWDQWFNGLNGAPSFESLNKQYNSEWRKVNRVGCYYQKRKRIIATIQARVEQKGVSTDSAVQLAEMFRLEHGRTVDQLCYKTHLIYP
ncbi:transcriptional activator of glycolytic enzymes-domain-containing protein [Gongronella butleri]|nr:transcriptional activator of glycolytic enzymes-domain-containing protein [Gongronella butleri]